MQGHTNFVGRDYVACAPSPQRTRGHTGKKAGLGRTRKKKKENTPSTLKPSPGASLSAGGQVPCPWLSQHSFFNRQMLAMQVH